jgi:hypothetical protein
MQDAKCKMHASLAGKQNSGWRKGIFDKTGRGIDYLLYLGVYCMTFVIPIQPNLGLIE